MIQVKIIALQQNNRSNRTKNNIYLKHKTYEKSCLFTKLYTWLMHKFLQKSVKVLLKAYEEFFMVGKEGMD